MDSFNLMSVGIIAASFYLFSICETLNIFQEEEHVLMGTSHACCSMFELAS